MTQRNPSRLTPRGIAYCLAFGLAASVTACASTQQVRDTDPLPDPGSDGEYTVDFPEPGDGLTRQLTMTVSEDVARRCNFEPHFQFDESQLRPPEAEKMRALAECLQHEQMNSFTVRLVGHADPRGTDDYNDDLAMSRAKTVRDMLVKNGVDGERVELTTHGETDAVGQQPEYAYGYDRRVDVELVPDTHTPVESGVSPSSAAHPAHIQTADGAAQ